MFSVKIPFGQRYCRSNVFAVKSPFGETSVGQRSYRSRVFGQTKVNGFGKPYLFDKKWHIEYLNKYYKLNATKMLKILKLLNSCSVQELYKTGKFMNAQVGQRTSLFILQ